MPKLSAQQRGEDGFALIEAMVAVLVFSLGILGLLGMQAVAIRESQDAKYRSDAAYLANQIISQMWVDRSSLATYANNASGSGCSFTPGLSANTNVTAWVTKVGNTLPGSPNTKQQIVVTAGTGSTAVTVTICWTRPQDSTEHSYVASAKINN